MDIRQSLRPTILSACKRKKVNLKLEMAFQPNERRQLDLLSSKKSAIADFFVAPPRIELGSGI
jgi:hypothetical protein